MISIGSRKRSFCDEEGNTDYDSALGGMNVDYKTSVDEFDSYCEAEQTTTLESSLTKRWNADFNEMLGKVDIRYHGIIYIQRQSGQSGPA